MKLHGAMKDNGGLLLRLPSGANFLSGACVVSGASVVRPAEVELVHHRSVPRSWQWRYLHGNRGVHQHTRAPSPPPHPCTPPLLQGLLIGEEVVTQLSETTRASANSTINVLRPCDTMQR